MQLPIKNRSRTIALAGLFGALALVLTFIEGLLPPIPLLPPGAKPGLSNIVVMTAADLLGLPTAIFIALIKGSFALFTRGATAGLMSLSGGILSALLMYLLLKRTAFSYILIGICGALAHNTAQLAVSLMLMGPAVTAYLPALVFFGILNGALTGLVFHVLYPKLKKVQITQ